MTTQAQAAALKWLNNRGGNGMFNKNGVLLARGELAGVMRMTWNALRDENLVCFLNTKTKRVVITADGVDFLGAYKGPEADTVEDEE